MLNSRKVVENCKNCLLPCRLLGKIYYCADFSQGFQLYGADQKDLVSSMCVIYFVWYFSIFLLYFSKILATNIDSITSYSKIREEIKSMYVCMYGSRPQRMSVKFKLLFVQDFSHWTVFP